MAPAVFTIASDLPFLDALVAGLTAESGADPLALARYTILLPTRRSARALSEAFLRRCSGRALLLPRLVPVGDVDADEPVTGLEPGEDDGNFDMPPAVPALRREILLTRLVLAWGRARGSGPLTAGQAAPLARALAGFLDEAQTEGCDLARLAALVPADHAEHWQQSLELLALLTEHWPRILAEIGCIDPAERRNRALRARAAAWRRAPPRDPVIAAGLTGGVAAVAELLAVVARLPKGAVILPGLDVDIADESWEEILLDAGHPQHLLGLLLQHLDVAPGDVARWPSPGIDGGRAARRRLTGEALRPAAESHRWRELGGADATALDGLMRLDCPGPQEEAATIALLLRQCLEEPEKTAALVTPDRALARRVASELRRWGIAIDDSAGVPLDQTPPGVFLRLLLDVAIAEIAPLPLLAALKHPLAAGGRSPEALRAAVRRLEIAVLRGPRPAPGFAGLRSARRRACSIAWWTISRRRSARWSSRSGGARWRSARWCRRISRPPRRWRQATARAAQRGFGPKRLVKPPRNSSPSCFRRRTACRRSPVAIIRRSSRRSPPARWCGRASGAIRGSPSGACWRRDCSTPIS